MVGVRVANGVRAEAARVNMVNNSRVGAATRTLARVGVRTQVCRQSTHLHSSHLCWHLPHAANTAANGNSCSPFNSIIQVT